MDGVWKNEIHATIKSVFATLKERGSDINKKPIVRHLQKNSKYFKMSNQNNF